MPMGAHARVAGPGGYAAAPGYPHMGQPAPGGGQYPGVGRGQYPPGAPGMPGGPHPGMGHGDYQGAMRGHAAMAGTMPTPGQMVPTHGQMGMGMSGMMATPGQAMEPPAKRAKTEGGKAGGKRPTRRSSSSRRLKAQACWSTGTWTTSGSTSRASAKAQQQQQAVEGTSMLEYWNV